MDIEQAVENEAAGAVEVKDVAEAVVPEVGVRERLLEACEELKRLLTGLLDSKGRVADEVHAIRKLCKSLRGGFSLLGMPEAGREIQAVGRMLSAIRDATSRRKTWDRLGWKDEGVAALAILHLLEQQTHSVARRPPPEAVDWAHSQVDLAIGMVEGRDGVEIAAGLDDGLKALDKAVRKRCRKMRRRGEEDFHEARKALKAYLGARAYLSGGGGEADPVRGDLAELLGDENDLATLSIWLRARGFTAKLVPELWKELGKARRKLQNRAIRASRKIVGK
jgi:hypothetical protein